MASLASLAARFSAGVLGATAATPESEALDELATDEPLPEWDVAALPEALGARVGVEAFEGPVPLDVAAAPEAEGGLAEAILVPLDSRAPQVALTIAQ